jgi:hypothetical protein
MKTIWKILIAILIAGGIAFVLQKIDKTPAEIQEKAEAISPQEGLPLAVEVKRQAIAQAAKDRDYAGLAALTYKESFSYTFGGAYPGGFEEYLKQNETATSPLDKAYKLLSLPYIQQGEIYTWPAVFAKGARDWTEDDIKMMREIYTDADIENFRSYGSYIGYRLGIREDGSWIYFINGD